MSNLIKYNQIDISLLDKRNFYQSLLLQCKDKNIIDECKLFNIQVELLEMLAKTIKKYTSNDSTSVREEIANNIMESLCFVIGVYLKSKTVDEQIELIKTKSVESVYLEAVIYCNKLINETKQSLKLLQKNAVKINNIAYNDTLYKGLDLFFTSYNINYFACFTDGSIDYPLFLWKEDCVGIEFIKDYIDRFNIENKFLAKFNYLNIDNLLRGYACDFKELLINVYRLVLNNTIAKSILNNDIYDINISLPDRENLYDFFDNLSVNELNKIIIINIYKICDILEIKDEEQIEYMKQVTIDLPYEIIQAVKNKTLDKLFITTMSEEEVLKYGYFDASNIEITE